jgi:hypothetical protein
VSPVGLCLYYEGWAQSENVLILNLKAIPPAISDKLLEAYYSFAMRNGLDSLYDSNGNLIPISERSGIDRPFYLVPPTILASIIGATNLNYAINKYNINNIISVKLIDWDNLGMLVKPRLSSRGLYPEPFNFEMVYEQFIKNSFE